jgi:regulation of enolase protein 1 (concanavalin A-like superfamily)
MSGDFVIESNHFEDVQIDADDAGVIVVNGMTFNSVIRNNLIHRVHRGFFSDNVAFWFDNMSSGWTVKNNIYYDIEQADMKTCGTYLSDNNYAENFHIESPQNAPEQFLDLAPEFASSNLRVLLNGNAPEFLATGSVVKVTAEIFNRGGSGVAPVKLLINRREVASQPFPVIRNNTRTVEFEWRLNEAGRQEISINETEPQIVTVQGEKPVIVCDQIQLSEDRILAGENVRISAVATNLQPTAIQSTLDLNLDGKPAKSQAIELAPQSRREIAFDLTPEAGDHVISIGNSAEVRLTVLRSQTLDLKKLPLQTYISPKARPAQVEVLPEEDRYTIKASGWDFYHAEDAYATVYLKQLKGDFVATAKIAAFGERTNQWFRSGLFVRNDISRSFDVERGSQGSVLMFSTPGRAGIQYDEFGDGCMHKAASENLPEDTPTPIWVRLERHGDRFTGYISLDGKTWMIKRQTKAIPGLQAAIDLGLAAGSPDQKQYTVEFTEWVVKVEARGN